MIFEENVAGATGFEKPKEESGSAFFTLGPLGFGVEEIAVRIRNNSHYRIGSHAQAGMLNGLFSSKISRAEGKGLSYPFDIIERIFLFMKKTLSTLAVLFLLAAVLLTSVSCSWFTVAQTGSAKIQFQPGSSGSGPFSGIWDDAIFTSDTHMGSGQNTATVRVSAEGCFITFTVNTDCTNLGEALQNVGLVEGEEGAYGLYVKKVNGMTADYDVDQSYWAFYIDGNMAMTGIDGEEIQEDVVYSLEYTK